MRSPATCLALVLLAAGASLALGPAPAGANWGPLRLVSKDAHEQADSASASALSANGRFVAFQGRIGGLKGVFREDLSSGAIVPVAAGDAYSEPPVTDAEAPSISADGRYVSFTTRAGLDPADDDAGGSSTGDRDVYVADLGSTPPRYELASALDGATTGLTYENSDGSSAAGRVALSGDGSEVVFVTDSASNLVGGVAGGTPAGEVVLRNLDTDATTLVSVSRDPLTGTMEPGVPVVGGAAAAGVSGASLSADGTTVAWLGTHLTAQVPTLAGDRTQLPGYDEPLWRRIGDGPTAPTRRIVGGSDPLAPGCPSNGSLADPACQGPFPDLNFNATCVIDATGWLPRGGVEAVPQLSADGRTVALIGQPNGFSNVFLVDMSAGLSRRQAVQRLTREVPLKEGEACSANEPEDIPNAGDVFDLAISPGGNRVAFATARQQFPLAPPNLVGSPPPGLGLTELYRVDIDGETLERATVASGGAPSFRSDARPGGTGATSPSFSAGGRVLAFSSTASNLVPGDANESSDVFVTEDEERAALPGAASISPAPQASLPRPKWRLLLSAFSRPDGDVRVVAVVPAAGALRARAEATDGHPRRVGLARARARAGGAVALTLTLPRRLRRQAHTDEGVYATARVSFRGRGGKPLHGRLEIRFRVHGGKGATGGRHG